MQPLALTPGRPQRFGSGRAASIAWPAFAAAGFSATSDVMLLFGTGLPVVGSVSATGRPFASVYPEKSPARMAAVGILLYPDWMPGFCLVYSCDQKKNSFCFLVLKTFGM